MWRAKFWYRLNHSKTFLEIRLDPKIPFFQQRFDEKLIDDQGRQWFKPDMIGEPDFVWVKEENTAAAGTG